MRRGGLGERRISIAHTGVLTIASRDWPHVRVPAAAAAALLVVLVAAATVVQEDEEDPGFTLYTEGGYLRKSDITETEDVSYVSSPYIAQCLRASEKPMTDNSGRAHESAAGCVTHESILGRHALWL